MEQDIKVIRKILQDLKFADTFIDILLEHLLKELKNSKHGNFTPGFLYTTSAFEIGRNNARDLADYFDEYKKTGNYRTNLQKLLDKSPWMK